jgi:hypothetical protein
MEIVMSKPRFLKSLMAVGALALAAAAPVSHAGVGDVYSATFQGVTFTFTQTDANTLTFRLAGTLADDWSTASYLGAFDLKDLGLNFSTSGATATGPGGPITGLNDQLSASAQDCDSSASPPGSICFDVNPNVAVSSPFDITYTIVFTDALNIASTGVHLQIVWTDTSDNAGAKIGSLYSQDVGLSSSSSSSTGSSGGDTSSSSSSSGNVPEPNSSSLALLGLAMLGTAFGMRRRKLNG